MVGKGWVGSPAVSDTYLGLAGLALLGCVVEGRVPCAGAFMYVDDDYSRCGLAKLYSASSTLQGRAGQGGEGGQPTQGGVVPGCAGPAPAATTLFGRTATVAARPRAALCVCAPLAWSMCVVGPAAAQSAAQNEGCGSSPARLATSQPPNQVIGPHPRPTTVAAGVSSICAHVPGPPSGVCMVCADPLCSAHHTQPGAA